MPESAESVRQAFDEIQQELGEEQRFLAGRLTDNHVLADLGADQWAHLCGARYQVAALREIAVQLARIADLMEGQALERRPGR
ncbi:MAG: hypothetical protein ACYSWU_27310 [Planctomycetota bacterium]|jgi:hypothetical protein